MQTLWRGGTEFSILLTDNHADTKYSKSGARATRLKCQLDSRVQDRQIIAIDMGGRPS